MEETFGPYRLGALLGRGGMGEVHRAVDTRKGRAVALKRLSAPLADDADFQVRFRREAELTARLREPHIVPIHDYGEIEGRLYLDMRLVEGTDLASLLGGGPLPPDRAVRIIAQIAEALDAAHADGLVHRDVKPSNVLLTDADFVQLIDFGLARAAAAARMTTTGSTFGTLAYMAPERFSGPGEGDRRVDVYALGAVLYEALTGSRPFPDGDAPRLMYAHLRSAPPDPADFRSDLACFRGVVARGLAKDPDDRFATAGDLAAAARAALGTSARPSPRSIASEAALPEGATAGPPEDAGPEDAGPEDAGPEDAGPEDAGPEDAAASGRPSRRRRRGWSAAVAVVLLAVAAVVVAVSGRVATPAPGGPAPVAPVSVTGPPTVPARVTPIATTGAPEDVVAAPDGRRVYVAELAAGGYRLAAVDTGRRAVTLEVPLPGESVLAVAPDGRRVYAAAHSGVVTVLDATTGAVTGSIPVGPYISTLVISPDGRRGYASYDGGIAMIDIEHLAVVATVPVRVAGTRQGMAVTADGARLHAISNDGLALSLTTMDAATGRVLAKDRANPSAESLVTSPDGRLYVVDANGTVEVRDANTAASVNATGSALGISQPLAVVSADGRRLLVNSHDDTIWVIDTAGPGISHYLGVGSVNGAFAASPDGRQMFLITTGARQGLVVAEDP